MICNYYSSEQDIVDPNNPTVGERAGVMCLEELGRDIYISKVTKVG